MDVNEVLRGTLSPDANIRNQAETQLSQAADADFAGYLTTLGQELANENAQADIRVAAGLALKNAFAAREITRLQQVQAKWVSEIEPAVKESVKELALKTLSSNDSRAGGAAAQFITAIASIEIPLNKWDQLMPKLVENVSSGESHQRMASLTTIGYICQADDPRLRNSLSLHSNAILTAVVQGARKEESSADVRFTAVTALSDCLEFVRSNFENEGERNFIMQVVCEATQSEETRIQEAAYGCLGRIMSIYYDKMRFYMEKALFGLTIMGMKSEDEEVAKLAIEFWCTVCEEEENIEDDNALAAVHGSDLRVFHNFALIATQEIVPVLLELMAHQDEDAADDEYNVSRAAYQCLQLWSRAARDAVTGPVIFFVEKHIRSEDWHYRDAAVAALGAIMEGPDEKVLDPIVRQALQILIGMMEDPVVHVQDSAAYALGRISEAVPDAIDPAVHLPIMIQTLFNGLMSNPKMASSCCWALMNLAERFAGDPGCDENPMTPKFQENVQRLLDVTERSGADSQLRTAAYEVLNAYVANCGNNSKAMVANLSGVILDRLEKTIPFRQQVVSVEDTLTLEDMQTSLTSVVMTIIQRLEVEVAPLGDRIMQVLLQLLNTVGPKSTVPDTVFATVGALATSIEGDFAKYMEAFAPYLLNGLSKQEEENLYSMSIGLVQDITRAIGPAISPFCDALMNSLLENLKSNIHGNHYKPPLVNCFGDIASAILGDFEKYMSTVVEILTQASTVRYEEQLFVEQQDYITSLREAVMDAWSGIIEAMKKSGKTPLLSAHIESIFGLIKSTWDEQLRGEGLMRSSMGVVGDLAEAFPHGEFAEYFRQDWLQDMVKAVRKDRQYHGNTTTTARWARDQIQRQIGT
ncbi:ARM repeat-containing protein [Eremomyces bilateralis CBS 781.70]|uniref:Importin-95 n=1 Tax=Eremomyces bilateralis CBS 781.70 TaxID=1392243 RepID=A0A6G1G1L7_9PEZI|nr:ARM repeat-containing protein [Eremomyces bilateralis CBS 781.70]KAF1811821.1 ARM repeat-containing protein [Eremomyces bilateralis CBS 781.70]